MKRTCETIFVAAALFCVWGTAGAARAESIGWNYMNGFFGAAEQLAPTDTAGYGIYAQANWNNHQGIGQGGTVPLNDLMNDAGAATTVDVTGWTLSMNNSWHHGNISTPNHRLMDGFNDREPTITFSNLGAPYTTDGYSVVVYYGNNEGPSTSALSVTGGVDDLVSRQIRTGNTAQGSYGSVGFVPWVDAATVSNVSIFEGLNDPAFTVALSGANNNGISAIQIVSAALVPQPPGVPNTPSPMNSAINVSIGTDLSWMGTPNTISYDVSLWKTGFAPLTQTVSTGLLDLPGDLDYGAAYNWQVTASNDQGDTPGPVWTFTTEAEPLVGAKSVGWNYVNGAFNDTQLGPEETAGYGIYAQNHWNNHVGVGQGPAATPLENMMDADGNATTVDVAWTLATGNSWHHNDPSNAPDNRLMRDFADQNPTMVFSDIGADFTANGYSVIVYYGNNEGPSLSTLVLTGAGDDAASVDLTTGNTAQAGYMTNGYLPWSDANTPSNVLVLTGLNDPGFTLSFQNLNNNGISAVQIVANPVPEPGAWLLLVFGTVGSWMMFRRLA